ncbi:MAG: efflux RND transporter periplasmic adaptor subunit [Pseudomonadales bacterium]|nr:efflux RND transporter periplasmic adaptor subunit [Pseudomonadales bacterium]
MRWLSWLGVVVVCGLVTAGLGFYKYNEIQAAIAMGQAFPEPAEAVERFVVREQTRRPSLSVTGEVVATQSATLQNELKGRIVNVGFAPGSRVEAGRVLLRLDVSQEQAQIAEARADQKIAQLALDRAVRLVKSGAGSIENRDQARAQFDSARARVSALAALIDKKTLRAPFDAITSLHQLEVGQYLDAGTEITMLVGVDDHVWIDFALPQDSAQVDIGSSVSVTYGDLEQLMVATVIARDASVNVRSRNLRLRAQLVSDAIDLLPGMLVRVSVPLGSVETVTVVPATAVRRDALGASVYLLEEVEEEGQQKTRARRLKVQLATIADVDQEADLIVIREGLKAGDQIAAIGAFKLRDGSLVIPSAPNEAAQDRSVGF